MGSSFTSVTVMVTSDITIAPKGSVAVTVTMYVSSVSWSSAALVIN